MKKTIGKSLQAARKAAGYKSARSFAEHMQYNVGTYTNWEQGKQMFSLEQACEMADALNCTLDELGGRARALEETYALTDDEKKLVDVYRSSSPVAQVAILSTVEAIAASIGEGVGTYTYEKVVGA